MKEKILIIATAAHEGGALIILKQFLNSVDVSYRSRFLILASNKLKDSGEFLGFDVVYVDTSKWIKRIYYDLLGFEKLTKQRAERFCGCLNFQNIPVRISNVKQVVYLHQSLPFYSYKWNLKDKKEIKMFFLSKFYAEFIKFNKKYADFFIVQSQWLADKVPSKLKFNKKNVFVFKPGVDGRIYNIPSTKNTNKIFLYPAFDYSYKNHVVIIKAILNLDLKELKDKGVKFYFTCDKFSWLSDKDFYSLKDLVIFTGALSYDDIINYYAASTCILFPSKIESFGLPLVEAAIAKKYIIASDLLYARDALSGYNNCNFVAPDSISDWSYFIDRHCKDYAEVIYEDHQYQYRDQWLDLISFINEKFHID